MRIITVDYESFWSTTYTLSKMSPLEYVLGPEYETICCAIKVGDEPTQVYWGHDAIAQRFAELDVPASALLAHNNSGFDSYISAYRFGLNPRMWLCTKAMAQPIHSKTTGNGLKQLVKHYRIGTKEDAILHATRGKHLADFTAEERALMDEYNKADTDQCYALFQKLKGYYNASELWQIDALTRMRTEPAFVLDVPLLEQALVEEKAAKREALLTLAKLLRLPENLSEDDIVEQIRSELASAPKFAKLLEAQGVAVPLKASPTNPEKQVPALAKTDQAFLDLQQHEDDIIAAAARTRLAIKSTLLETRIEKFLKAGALAGGRLPMPVRYCGADTTGRDSGEEYNPQNLPRIDHDRPKRSDALRAAITAPPGYKIIVADQSGIELRVSHTLWKVPSSMEMWKLNPVADLYRRFAAVVHGVPEDQISKFQRQAAKVAQLQLQFGSGWKRYQEAAAIPWGITLSDQEAMETTYSYRSYYTQIVDGWKSCQESLPFIRDGEKRFIDPWEMCYTEKGAVVLPSGRRIRYPDLRQEVDKKTGKVEWVYGHGRHRARLYGGKMTENIVQALARDSIFDAAFDFFKATGYRFKLRVHDELVYVVPEEEAERLLGELQSILRTPPRWWPELVVWSEGAVASTYAAAK